jgi:hypothetical protein
MGLAVEHFPRRRQRLAVADYVPDADKAWLQTNRIELNAMTTPQFLKWLDAKFEPYRGKVIPPDDVLQGRLDAKLREEIRGRITRAIMRKYDVPALVERAIGQRRAAIDAAREGLGEAVRRNLQEHPKNPWTRPVERMARNLSRRPAMERNP